VKGSDFRTFIVLWFVGIFALLVHAFLIPIFMFIGLPEMSYLNYGSVLFWIIGLWLNFNGNYSAAIKVFSCEVLIHSYFAVSIMGLSLGFQHYLWAIACMALLAQDIPRVFSVLIGFTIIIFLGVLHFLFSDVQYLYEYAELIPIIHFVNVLVAGIPLTYSIVAVLHTSSNKERYLAKAAAKDEFTGLYNKNFSYEMLGIVLSQADRLNSPVCIIKGSIDHYKNIEETYGSDVSSQLLLDISGYIKETIRCSDIAALWENNDFFIVLSGINIDLAYIKIDSLREGIFDNIKIGEDKNISVSMSCGLAEWKQGDSVNNIIKQADKALKLSKKNGHNRTTTFKRAVVAVNTI
jgi:diguanylate cyclase (GGDEF)-like protein